MDISENIKNDLMVCQQKLRGAIGLHQKLFKKLKANPKDRRELTEKLVNAENLIRSIAKQQKPLVQELRDELDRYHDKLKREKKPVNYDADTAYIEQQLEEYQNERNKYKTLVQSSSLSQTSFEDTIDEIQPTKKFSMNHISSKRTSVSSQEENGQETPQEQKKIKMNEEKPKSKFLEDRRSKLLSVLNKVCKQNTASVCDTTTSIVEIPDDPIIVKSEKTSPPTSPELTIVHDASEMVKERPQDQEVSSHLTTISLVSEYEHNNANNKLEDLEASNSSYKDENQGGIENIDDDFQSCAADENSEYYCDGDNLDNHEDNEHINQDDIKDIGMNANDKVLNSNTNLNNDMEKGNQQIEENDKTVDNNNANSEEETIGESEDFVRTDKCENNEGNEVEQVMKKDSNKMETIIKNDGTQRLDESKEMETSDHIEDLELSASSMEPDSKEQFFS